MSQVDCGDVRERIPEYAAGRLGQVDAQDVERHLGGCSECRAETDLARTLLASRIPVPPALADRVMRAVRTEGGRRQRPWWGISAAAVAALALGIGINADRSTGVVTGVPAFATEFEEGDLWSSDDGLLAGAPSIESLTDQALMQLLAELDSSSDGGAA